MLNNFFRINLPYGIAKNQNDEWMAFNREYMPLGFNNMKYKKSPGDDYLEMPIYTKYKDLDEKIIMKIVEDEKDVERNDEGVIIKFYLYDDATNPTSNKDTKEDIWNKYFNKINILSRLIIK